MLAEHPEAPDAQIPPSKARIEFLDATKGIGILCVIALHSSGRSARTLLSQGSAEWWIVTGINRLMAFAVPMFLCVSAFLWARSEARGVVSAESKDALLARPRSHWIRLVKGTARRFTAILNPYLLWSVLFVLWQAYVEKVPFVNLLTGKSIYNDLIWGKAYFHLYFLSILLQAAFFFPLMLWLVRRTGFLACCATSVAAQAIVFFLQTRWQFLPYPGSSLLWYLTSLVPAAWLGANWPAPSHLIKQLRTVSLFLAVISGAAFLWLERLEVLKVTRYSGLTNPVQQIFVFGGAFAVIAGLALKKPSDKRPWRWLCWLGASSLPFYLLHPMVMRFLSGPSITHALQSIPLAPLWCYGALLLATGIAVVVLSKIKAEKLLFGRVSPPMPIARSPQEP